MKKMISVLLVAVLMTLTLCTFSACSGGTNLSLSNYETYFTIRTRAETAGSLNSTSDHAYYGKTALDIICSVNPISNNFVYKDVVMKVKLSGSYKYFDTKASWDAHHEVYDEPQSFETTVTINVNIAGNGSAKETYAIPEGKLISAFSSDTAKNFVVCNYEVLSVSGTIEKA